MGWDISGKIVQVGDDVFSLLNFPTFSQLGHAKGYAEYVVSRLQDILLKPSNITYDEVAAVQLIANNSESTTRA
ncbi:hypothetical protein [Chryseobacterium wanjuense]